MWELSLELFKVYKHDEDCWGMNILSCGMMDRALFGFHSDEDGWYLNIFWFCEWKIRDTRITYEQDDN
jgi:hypothetical protein